MTITERTRHELHHKLRELLGEEEADTLMEHLPPVGWADVTTKDDLRHTEALFRRDLDRLGTELRGEMTQLGTELRGEMTQLGTELRGEMTTLRADLMESQRNLTLSFIGSTAAIATLAVTVSHLIG